MNIDSITIKFMELDEIEESAKALSIAMLNNSLHIAVLKGNDETQRLKIESMFVDLFHHNPGITYLAKEKRRIVGVMRMQSCCGSTWKKEIIDNNEENDIDHRIKIWHQEWAVHDPMEQHWHLGPIGVIPTHQDQGIGSMLMTLFCKEVDRCSAKAFLETDLDKNVSFYEKFGFKVVTTSIFLMLKADTWKETLQNTITHHQALSGLVHFAAQTGELNAINPDFFG